MRYMPVPKSTVGNAARNEVAVEKLKHSTVSVVKHSTMATAWKRRGRGNFRGNYVVMRIMARTTRRMMLMTSNTFHIETKYLCARGHYETLL